MDSQSAARRVARHADCGPLSTPPAATRATADWRDRTVRSTDERFVSKKRRGCIYERQRRDVQRRGAGGIPSKNPPPPAGGFRRIGWPPGGGGARPPPKHRGGK